MNRSAFGDHMSVENVDWYNDPPLADQISIEGQNTQRVVSESWGGRCVVTTRNAKDSDRSQILSGLTTGFDKVNRGF